jgi:hypothetical protein
MTTGILAVVMIVLIVLYVARRRARLKAEDDR